MPEISENDQTEAIAKSAARGSDAWQQTLEDMNGLATRREELGWETVCIAAGDTGTETPDAGNTDRYGLVHVIPGNDADAFRDAFGRGEFPRYDVYRGTTESWAFLVTELLDPGTETAIYIAGSFMAIEARELAVEARAREQMYTHVQKLDGTHLGSFEHDGYEKFFPEADRIVETLGDE